MILKVYAISIEEFYANNIDEDYNVTEISELSDSAFRTVAIELGEGNRWTLTEFQDKFNGDEICGRDCQVRILVDE